MTMPVESSPSYVQDTPAARPVYAATHSPSSNSCGRQVAQRSEEIPQPAVPPVRPKDLRRKQEDRRERLCREAIQLAREKT